MAASAPPFDQRSNSRSDSQFPFEFAPQRSQDSDLLRQLNFLPGLKELLMVRQVHAFEDATASCYPNCPPADCERRMESGCSSAVRHEFLCGHSADRRTDDRHFPGSAP